MLGVRINLAAIEHFRDGLVHFPDDLHAELKVANVNTAAVILRRIKNRLQSGEPLKKRTGTLLRSWSMKAPREYARGIGWIGGVGSNLEYAAVHEYGFRGAVNVRAHLRHSARTRMASGKFRKREKGATATINVRAHVRQMNLPARPYARPSIEESIDQAQREHIDAVSRAWERFRNRNA